MRKNKRKQTDHLHPGMQVEAQGDLGEQDVSKPRIASIHKDAQGHVKDVAIQKGVLFRKEIDIPAERIEKIDPSSNGAEDKVVVNISADEADALTAQGTEEITSKDNVLSKVQENLPTVEGLRALEQQRVQADTSNDAGGHISWWRVLGPGFLSGMAGNDASAVGAYSIDGTRVGMGHLWLMLLSTPLYQSVQYSSAKIGRITQAGLGKVLSTYYGRPVAILASLILIVANVALVTADLVAVSSGIELLFGIDWLWWVVPVAIALWYLTVYSSFERIKKIFIGMSFVFIVYLITAILARPDWGQVLFNTVVPHINLSFASISSAVALLGATISPYTIYWQVQGEKEEKRPGNTKRKQLRFAALDVALGALGGNLIAYCIMLTTAATLFIHHKTIITVVDAASALTPLVGPFARYLFALGFIGAGLVAIPVLLASTSYAVAGTFGWPGALSKKPWQSEGFYLILTCSLIVSLILALIRIDPVQLIFWANVLNGVLSPVLVVYLLLVGNNKKIMKGQVLSLLTNIGLVVTFLVMASATILLLYGLFTGKGS